MANTDEELVNVPWVKSLLTCSNTTIHRHIVADILPKPLKIGRERLWVKSGLVAHLIKVGKVKADD